MTKYKSSMSSTNPADADPKYVALGDFIKTLHKEFVIRYDDLGFTAHLGSARVFAARGEVITVNLIGGFNDEYSLHDPDLFMILTSSFEAVKKIAKATGKLSDYFQEPLVDIQGLMGLFGSGLPVSSKYLDDDEVS